MVSPKFTDISRLSPEVKRKIVLYVVDEKRISPEVLDYSAIHIYRIRRGLATPSDELVKKCIEYLIPGEVAKLIYGRQISSHNVSIADAIRVIEHAVLNPDFREMLLNLLEEYPGEYLFRKRKSYVVSSRDPDIQYEQYKQELRAKVRLFIETLLLKLLVKYGVEYSSESEVVVELVEEAVDRIVDNIVRKFGVYLRKNPNLKKLDHVEITDGVKFLNVLIECVEDFLNSSVEKSGRCSKLEVFDASRVVDELVKQIILRIVVLHLLWSGKIQEFARVRRIFSKLMRYLGGDGQCHVKSIFELLTEEDILNNIEQLIHNPHIIKLLLTNKPTITIKMFKNEELRDMLLYVLSRLQ